MPLVAHYPLHEDSGSTAYDVRGSNDGTTSGGVTQGANGILGTTAYDFEGTDDYVNVGTFSLTNITTSAWIYIDSVDGSIRENVVSNWDGTDGSLQLDIGKETSDIKPDIFINIGGTNYSAVSPSTYSTGAWLHLAAAYSANTGDVILYINGVEVDRNKTGNTNWSSSTTNWNIGRGSDGTSYTDGRIADVRVYDHALSAAEVQYLYEVSLGGSAAWKRKVS